jgi:hypothetical protein
MAVCASLDRVGSRVTLSLLCTSNYDAIELIDIIAHHITTDGVTMIFSDSTLKVMEKDE